MRLLSWLVSLPVALAAVLFAISNRESVTLALWPLPFTVTAPVYLAALLALLAGFLAGGAVVWFGQHGERWRAGRLARRVSRLEEELRQAKQRAATAEKRLAELKQPVSGAPAALASLPMPPSDRASATLH